MTDPYYDADDYSDISEENESSASRSLEIPTSCTGERLDAALAQLLSEFSRSRLTQWIKDGKVSVDGQVVTLPKHKVLGGEQVLVKVGELPEEVHHQPEPMDIPVIYEDEHLLVINKPAGLVVHPAAGNWSGTLLNGLLHYCPQLAEIPRAGIVHRLDKETSGLMVVAKTLLAQTDLVRQLQDRSVKRIYRAIADGLVPFDGTISTQIGRDPHNRLRMAVLKFGGKPAITHVRVLERFENHSYIECRLETGRTHQIRVHMKEARHPLSGDPLYGNPRHRMQDEIRTAVAALGRQALHAHKLSLVHPATGETMSWSARLPNDMRALLAVLRGEGGFAMGGEHDDDDDDWNDDDYDVEVQYVR